MVDDDPGVREALGAALAPRYAVYGAATGAEACALLRSRRVAAIILDAVLGSERGLDLVERFRRLSPAPILLLTGHGSEALAARALRAKVEDYLKKPISLRDLSAALDRVVPRVGVSPELADQVRTYLQRRVRRSVRLGDLARRLGVSEAHLRRRFREAYGMTPRQYLLALRLQRAAALLRGTRRSVKQVAAEAGFANLTVFRRQFAKAMGLSPFAFRAAAKL